MRAGVTITTLKIHGVNLKDAAKAVAEAKQEGTKELEVKDLKLKVHYLGRDQFIVEL